jgi:hypothetical protein
LLRAIGPAAKNSIPAPRSRSNLIFIDDLQFDIAGHNKLFTGQLSG